MYLESNGQLRTDSLFKERIAKRHIKSGLKPLYRLSERSQDKELTVLYNIFINSIDEYDFAIKAFGAKAQLDKLKTIKWFNEGWPGCGTFRGYNEWLDDMRERDASTAKKILIEKAMDGDTGAAKKLADMSKNPNKGAGRPKKEDIARAAREKADDINSLEEDMQRLNVVKIR